MKASPLEAEHSAPEHILRTRPLQGEQSAILEFLDAIFWLERLAHVGEVDSATRGIGDHEQTLAHAADDQVVEDAALCVGEHRVAKVARGQPGDIARHQPLQRLSRARAADQRLAHVRHIEQRRGRTAVPMLRHDAARVLHRQRPAGEVDQFAAQLDVKVVERSAARDRVGARGSRVDQSRDLREPAAGGLAPGRKAPSVPNLRD